MADFTVQPTYALTATSWVDEPRPPDTDYVGDPGAPSRLNVKAGRIARFWHASYGAVVEVSAVVDGIVGPLDLALGGRLFTGWVVEWPGGGAYPVTSPAGQSSVLRIAANHPGHWCVAFRRPGSGTVAFHFDVEAP